MDLFSTNVAYASVDTFVAKVNSNIINPIILFLFALAIVIFLWGVAEFILNQSNEEKVTTGKQHMIWGIIGIVIMMGVWTILGVILSTMGITDIKINKDGNVGDPKVELRDYNPSRNLFK